jgi:hypothetical protein
LSPSQFRLFTLDGVKTKVMPTLLIRVYFYSIPKYSY